MWDRSARDALQTEVFPGELTLSFLTVKEQDTNISSPSAGDVRAAGSLEQSCTYRRAEAMWQAGSHTDLLQPPVPLVLFSQAQLWGSDLISICLLDPLL